MERRKLFSNLPKVRRSLFSDSSVKTRRSLFGESTMSRVFSDIRNDIYTSKPRRSLFANVEEDTCTCSDCGHTFSPEKVYSEGTTVRCPNCGGSKLIGSDKNFSLGSLDETDEILKTFSDQTVSVEEVDRIFSQHGINESADSMVNAGYATYTGDDQICFSERPDLTRKLFSALEISVTKTLRLEPVDSKEALIQRLSDSPTMPAKAVMLIRKAHGIAPQEDWIGDSRIIEHLKDQHGGTEMPLSGFQGLLKEQYNDAPSDVLDKLVSLGAIDIAGNRVIIKH